MAKKQPQKKAQKLVKSSIHFKGTLYLPGVEAPNDKDFPVKYLK